MIDWPDQLIDDLARRRTVIVLGSGVSRHSIGEADRRPPDWKTFLLQAVIDCPGEMNKDHISLAIDRGDYLHACEWLKRRFDEGWVRYLRQVFQMPRFTPSALHRKILDLDARIVFSLNFDSIYERTAEEIHAGWHIVKSYSDPDVAEFLRGDGRYIVKVHGTLNSPNSLIFTQNDYARARTTNVTFYQAFDACLLTHSFLFLGAGYSDPDIALLLENQMFNYPMGSPHYFVTSADMNDDMKISLRTNRNLKTLHYDPIDDNHSNLSDEVDGLNILVDERRKKLLETGNW